MNDLIQLIHALSAKEKKFFRETTRGEKLLQYFDFIDKNRLADAEIVKKQPFYSRAMTNNLQVAVLKSLRAKHENLSTDRKIDNLLHEFDILANKKQFKLAEKKIKEGLSLCDATKKNPKSRIRLLQALKFVQYYTRKPNERAATNARYVRDLELISDEINQLKIYLEGQNKMGVADTGSGVQNVKTQQQDIFDKLKSFVRLSNIGLNYHRYLVQLRLVGIERDVEAMIADARALVAHYSTRDKFSNSLRDENSSYTKVFDLLMAMAVFIRAEDYEAAYQVYRQIIQTEERGPVISLLLVNQVLATAINLLLNLGKVSEAISLIEEEVPRWDGNLYESKGALAVVPLAKSMAYFCNKDFKKANQFVRDFAALRLNLKREMTKGIQLYEVVIFCELGKLELATSRNEATYRSFKKSGALTEFDRVVYNFIGNFVGNKLIGMKKEFATASSLFKDKGSRQVNGSVINIVFNFIGWMESKAMKVPFKFSSG